MTSMSVKDVLALGEGKAQFQNGTATGPRREIVSDGRRMRKWTGGRV